MHHTGTHPPNVGGGGLKPRFYGIGARGNCGRGEELWGRQRDQIYTEKVAGQSFEIENTRIPDSLGSGI